MALVSKVKNSESVVICLYLTGERVLMFLFFVLVGERIPWNHSTVYLKIEVSSTENLAVHITWSSAKLHAVIPVLQAFSHHYSIESK